MRRLALLLLLATLVRVAGAEPAPQALGFDPAKLAAVPERMQEFVARGEIAGAVTLVGRHGQVVQLTAVGQADLASGRAWGLGFQVVKEPQGVTASLSPGTFGHGGAYATQSWGDPQRDLIYILLLQRAGLPNGDASEMRAAFQQAATDALAR